MEKMEKKWGKDAEKMWRKYEKNAEKMQYVWTARLQRYWLNFRVSKNKKI